MIKSDSPRFATAIGGMMAALGHKADEMTLSGFWMALEDMQIDAIEAGAKMVARTSSGFPKPVDVRRAAGERSPAEIAAEAWEVVCKLAKNSRSAKHPDPVAESAVLKLGGWRKIGFTGLDQMVWIRKEFIELYQDGSTGEPVRKMIDANDPKRLTGPDTKKVKNHVDTIAAGLAKGMEA